MTMQQYRKAKIRALRANHPALMAYLDEEIERTYSLYCELFHASSWTEVDPHQFVTWATQSPLERAKNE